jgi:hypothetical protein
MEKNIQSSFLKFLLISILPFLFISCGTTVNFPISDYLPAADVKAKIKKDENNIFEVTVKADHLAEPERLTPPKKRYIVWVKDVDGANHKIGELDPGKSKEGELNAMTPFEPVQLFITAEDKKNPKWPSTSIIFRSEIFNLK